MKRIFSTLLVLVLLLSSIGFAAAEDTVNITVFHYMAQATKQAGLVAIEEAYSALHPKSPLPTSITTRARIISRSCPPRSPRATSPTS